MSERQEPYVLRQAREIVAQAEQKRQFRTIEELKRKLQGIEARSARKEELVHPVKALLCKRFGPHWLHATLAEFAFPGEIKLVVAVYAVQIGDAAPVVETALVYQVGDSAVILSPEDGQ